jgi:EAL domain-containing protein (putative c-di-GMP-specific phosphodiesterase class I)
VLEIIESILMADTQVTIGVIEQIKALGVGLSIDDFGTGYSSLSYLHRFRFDVLKIDKCFVDDIDDRPDQSAAFIRTIVALGHNLGMHIIAEGIETTGQFRWLAHLGADAGQGPALRPLSVFRSVPSCAQSRVLVVGTKERRHPPRLDGLEISNTSCSG